MTDKCIVHGPTFVHDMEARILAYADRIEALEAERDELLHDLERLKDSETDYLNRAVLAEQEKD